MGYNIVLELNPEQKQRLKLTATTANQTVRGFVTGLVVKAIDGTQSAKTRNKKGGTS